LCAALDGLRGSRAHHDPGRVLVDLAVAIADGAEAISDIAMLADQQALFGPVASDSTCWRLLEALDDAALAAVAAARARAREVAWAQRAETTGSAFDRSRVAGATIGALVIDLDAHNRGVSLGEGAGRAPTLKRPLPSRSPPTATRTARPAQTPTRQRVPAPHARTSTSEP
jgi:hypothetical protein